MPITIPLTKGYTAIIDSADGELVLPFKWLALECKCKGVVCRVYAARAFGEGQRGKLIYMHRALMGNPNAMVDHRNGDSLDNQRHNLRVATRA